MGLHLVLPPHLVLPSHLFLLHSLLRWDRGRWAQGAVGKPSGREMPARGYCTAQLQSHSEHISDLEETPSDILWDASFIKHSL